MKIEAVVQFVTVANGSYKYMRGLTRGYWRVDVVDTDIGPCKTGFYKLNSKAHKETLYQSPYGLFGVTYRSRYYLGGYLDHAESVAKKFNGEQPMDSNRQ